MLELVTYILKQAISEWMLAYQNQSSASLEYIRIFVVSIGWISGLLFWSYRKEHNISATH